MANDQNPLLTEPHKNGWMRLYFDTDFHYNIGGAGSARTKQWIAESAIPSSPLLPQCVKDVAHELGLVFEVKGLFIQLNSEGRRFPHYISIKVSDLADRPALHATLCTLMAKIPLPTRSVAVA